MEIEILYFLFALSDWLSLSKGPKVSYSRHNKIIIYIDLANPKSRAPDLQ